jgi:sigma-B regulation protein RsbU (phosphoserine phosphatase)
MNGSAPADSAALPPGILDLLDAFRQAWGNPDMRLFAPRGDAWTVLYPEPGRDCHPDPRATSTAVVIDGAAPLLLEVRSGDVRSADLDVLSRVLGLTLKQEQEARSTARELTERYEEINLLYLISEILGAVLSLEDAATRILAEVVDVLGARRASLWVYRGDEDALHLAAAVGEDGLAGPIAAADTESATAGVFREKQPLNLERGGLSPAAARLEPRPHGGEPFLSVPINYTPPEGGARTVGVITLVGRRNDAPFSAGDVRLLAAIASQVGAALETQRLVQESLRQERMVRELELAHDLQLKLLPDPADFEEGTLRLAARCVPADSVGGDFYQLFRLPEDRMGIMIGDVSSHGFPAALIMALVMSAVGIHAPAAGAPAEVLARVQRALQAELDSTEMYLSLFCAVIDSAAGRLVWANAGHPQAFHIARDGTTTRLGATSTPLGLVPRPHYEEQTIAWAHGDVLLLFTDGLSDSLADVRGDRTGEAVLVDLVTNRRNAPLEETIAKIFATPESTAPQWPADDRTILLVRG